MTEIRKTREYISQFNKYTDDRHTGFIPLCTSIMAGTGSLFYEPPEVYASWVINNDTLLDIDSDDDEYENKLENEKKSIVDKYYYLSKKSYISKPSRDIYSCGLILWIIINRYKEKRQDPYKHNFHFKYDNVDSDVKSVIMNCLQLLPEKRPSAYDCLLRLGVSEEDVTYYLENGKYRE